MSDADILLPTTGATAIRLGGAVSTWLTDAIIDGRLKVGDALPPEGRLATAFGVSKPVVREAVRELAAHGVIQIQQGKVARVRAVDASGLSQFYRFAVSNHDSGLADANELRKLIEPSAAGLAARRATPEGLQLLKAAIDRLVQAAESPDNFTDADIAFHETIASITGNRLLALQMQGLRPVIRQVSQLFTTRRARTKAEWKATVARHVAIFEAIAAGREPEAVDAMRKHFDAADVALSEIEAKRKGTAGPSR